MNKKPSAVVVLSGGQDSVTCLGLAIAEYEKVYCLAFNYGQKHSIEITQAQLICNMVNVPLTIMSIPALAQLGDSALLIKNNLENKEVGHAHPMNPDLPSSFVPNRNALFLTTAHAFAQHVGSNVLITGVCETDYSGYPDCRYEFIIKLQDTLNIGYGTNIKIRTPLMFLNKAQTFALAEAHGFLDIVLDHSHTCYNGSRENMYSWGAGCGACPACNLRKKGFLEYLDLYRKGDK